MAKYTFKCPGCSAPIVVKAENDDEAVDKLMVEGGNHKKEDHPNDPEVPEEDMKKMVREQMTKEEQSKSFRDKRKTILILLKGRFSFYFEEG